MVECTYTINGKKPAYMTIYGGGYSWTYSVGKYDKPVYVGNVKNSVDMETYRHNGLYKVKFKCLDGEEGIDTFG